ncbi:tRNA 2-selenouridine synthase [Campylobacter jejuni]|uniref:tRNA 2-selenouridine synthase n=1 Tax=Campylobacter jejuni TaxID=197 RepID=UPI0020449CDE|nr:tRNA 2-selenouridine synthase [Campylobacter jejuni]
MKITMIILSLFFLVSLSACAFKDNKASELETLASNYGGIYIFDKKIREEILENERKKGEAMKKMSLGDDFWDQLKVIEKKFPQVLSNGCKYYRDDYINSYKIGESNFNFKDKPEFAYYEDQFKAYMGEENYKKLKPYLIMSSYYVCKGKRYPITFYTMIDYKVKSYGLFGDEGRGFSFSSISRKSAGGGHFHYFTNGKFIKSDEKYTGQSY